MVWHGQSVCALVGKPNSTMNTCATWNTWQRLLRFCCFRSGTRMLTPWTDFSHSNLCVTTAAHVCLGHRIAPAISRPKHQTFCERRVCTDHTSSVSHQRSHKHLPELQQLPRGQTHNSDPPIPHKECLLRASETRTLKR